MRVLEFTNRRHCYGNKNGVGTFPPLLFVDLGQLLIRNAMTNETLAIRHFVLAITSDADGRTCSDPNQVRGRRFVKQLRFA